MTIVRAARNPDNTLTCHARMTGPDTAQLPAIARAAAGDSVPEGTGRLFVRSMRASRSTSMH